jgi:hypothetical protein
VEGVFESWFRKNADPAIQAEIYSKARAGDRLVVTKALWLNGFSAEVEFDSASSAGARAGIPAGAAPASKLGFAAKLRWRGNETLIIETSEPFAIAGELSRFTPAGIRGEGAEGAAPGFALKPVAGLDEGVEIIHLDKDEK